VTWGIAQESKKEDRSGMHGMMQEMMKSKLGEGSHEMMQAMDGMMKMMDQCRGMMKSSHGREKLKDTPSPSK